MNIKNLLPHRGTMLLIDNVVSVESNLIVTRKFFHSENIFFDGHFPDEPLLPGVVLVEMMFQTSGILYRLQRSKTSCVIDKAISEPNSQSGRAVQIKSVNFVESVAPNTEIIIHATMSFKIKQFAQFNCEAYAQRRLVCNGVVTIKIA